MEFSIGRAAWRRYLSLPRLAGGVVLALLALAAPARSAYALQATEATKDFKAPVIHVAPGDWGRVDRAEIQQVLSATARELSLLLPARPGAVIRVERSDRVPKVLYERNADGEYVVFLTVRGRRWAEYTYEFAHELCHVYANFQHRPNTALAPHQWFEESLCETASLFVLRRMSRNWQPPPLEHRDYAPFFSEYASLLIGEPHRHGSMALGPWYAMNAARLSHDPYGRDHNEYCANRLLTLFEALPEGWRALPYLNSPTNATELSFAAYLQHWRDAAPAEQRPFLDRILTLFGLLPEARSEAPAASR